MSVQKYKIMATIIFLKWLFLENHYFAIIPFDVICDHFCLPFIAISTVLNTYPISEHIQLPVVSRLKVGILLGVRYLLIFLFLHLHFVFLNGDKSLF